MNFRKWFPFFLSGLFLFLWFPINVFSDTPQKVDSLRAALQKQEGLEKLYTYQRLIASIRNIDPAQGIEVSKSALALADSIKEPILKAKIINEQGVCYRKLNIPENALKLHLDALEIFETFRDSSGISYTLANIGNVYHLYREFDKALDFHFRSLYLKEYLKDESQIAYSQNAIGMVLADMQEYARALDFYISAMAIREKNNEKLEAANVYANIGKVMVKLSRFDDALGFLNKALGVYLETKSEYGQSLVLNQMAELLYQHGDIEEAMQKLKEAEKIALEQGNISVLHFNYKLQKDVLKKKGLFEDALKMAEIASVYKDSLFSERRNYEMSELQVRYETRQLDSENEILKLKLKEQDFRFKNLLLGSFSIILFLIIGFLIWLFFQKRKEANRLESLNLSLEKRVDERTEELKVKSEALQMAFNSLKQSEEKLRIISETSPFGIAVTDKNGKIIFCNQSLPLTSGLEKSEFESGIWMQHILFEDRQLIERLWKSGHAFEKPLPDTSFRIRIENEIRWMRMKGGPMADDNGFLGLVVVMENITESKKFEQDLIKAKNKAEESDKIKSAFLANMSHEIRTPMNAILGFSDLLSSDEYTAEEKVEFVDMIRSSGKLLLNLINDIIDISKIEAGELKIHHSTFPLQPQLDELYYTFRQQLDIAGKSNVKLILSQRESFDGEEITTDKLRLQQIMTNLLSNAVKFTNEGQIEFGAIRVSNKFEFFVKDTGIGIPESKLDVIFERFRQADDSHTRLYGGTGLGLAITKNLTFLLGGEIWVESVQNKGTAFYLTLQAENKDSNNTDNTLPDYTNKTVLVAEDVDTNFQLINNMLKRSNINVLHAVNGLIALDMAIERNPDLILMDIQMPDLDGRQALLQLRERNYNNPVIAITAFALAGEGESYLDFGFDSYLSKPLGLDKLYGMLSLFLNHENQETHK
ncbi:MAG: ATP-binding protein [Bacteroidales bacterium]|nr:ATP-binding protein [Bacteroidales bacterium]